MTKKEMTSLFNIELDISGKNKPCTIIFSPKGEILKRVNSMDARILISELENLQSNGIL